MTTNAKHKVTVIGLGDMGAALAHAYLQQGYTTTVWNRSAAKSAPLQAAGAAVADSVTTAIAAGDIIILCVTDYTISRSLLQTPEVTALLKTKILIQLSSGTPGEARELDSWATENGITFLDGAIMAIPDQVGRPDTVIFVSGNKDAYTQSEATLKAVAGALQYMGEDPGAASTWDMGFLIVLFAAMSGAFHAIKLFKSEGLPAAALGNMIQQLAPALGEMLKHQADIIEGGNYHLRHSSLDLCTGSMDMFIKQAKESNISAEVPSFIKGIFKRAQDAGFGTEHVAAAYKTY
ncbi:NAD(P)-dependent oxidoreductase [Chitinophaga qingshengii]|uniref:NAD(P)-dependent oxidoreductase n=1 Tax=Chitinophaga qingshengii TaxID=1569794 RepID=A0ABR7TRA4_9BACT|nr:NAD(P)-binding domain-containing protein [Chitinophaga qingshengii]MBC9932155.1 NAD(P)-dependent oxidoreductase [Chitinophaga qingshengii]